MSEELKDCPLCGSHAERVDMLYSDEISHNAGVFCPNPKCPLHQPFYLHEWQSRPIEDDLQRSLDALFKLSNEKEIEIVALRAKLEEAKEALRQIDELMTYDLDHEEDGNGYQIEAIAHATLQKLVDK